MKNVGNYNAGLVVAGKIGRFSYIRPGTGKRGRPGHDRLNDLSRSDTLVFDEIEGVAYQAPNLGLSEVGEAVEIPRLRAVA